MSNAMKRFRCAMLFAALLAAIASCERSPSSPDGSETPAFIALSVDSLTLNAIGDTATVSADVYNSSLRRIASTGVEWQSLEPAVATVNAEGVVRSQQVGEARIVGRDGDAADTARVVVRQVIAGVELLQIRRHLLNGDSAELQATAVDSNGAAVAHASLTWSSSDESVAVVSAGGVVKAIALGEATITSRRSSSQSASYDLRVIPRFSAIGAAGGYSCGLTPAGAAYCWGQNGVGQLGGAEGSVIPYPVPVQGGQTFSFLAVGQGHSCALMPAEEAYCWGGNDTGKLGDGTLANSAQPVAVQGGLRFSHIAAGRFHSCGIALNGDAYCWGSNSVGQLGSLTSPWYESLTPVLVAGGHSFRSVTAGELHTCARTQADSILCWGSNTPGQFGNGEMGPGVGGVNATPGYTGLTLTQIMSGHGHSCGLTMNGIAYCAGFNPDGQVGNGTLLSSPVPVQTVGGHTYTAIAAGGSSSCAAEVSGSVYCWGEAGGNGTTRDLAIPTKLPNVQGAVSVAVGQIHGCAVSDTGVTYCWGSNQTGQLGVGDTLTVTQPVRLDQF